MWATAVSSAHVRWFSSTSDLVRITHVVRILTGIPFGFGLGILFIGMSCARAQYFQSADAVVLPGGVKFILQSSVKESE